MDQIRKVPSLHRADIFQPSDRIVFQLERFPFNSCEPSPKAIELKRILLPCIHEKDGTRSFELRTATLGKRGD